jgi:uncharacterized membrane protein YhaH (DUF805 family)
LPFVIFPTVMSFSLSARVPASGWPWLDLILSLASVVLSIWGWVEIGFRRGVVGPNRYGEDPYASV